MYVVPLTPFWQGKIANNQSHKHMMAVWLQTCSCNPGSFSRSVGSLCTRQSCYPVILAAVVCVCVLSHVVGRLVHIPEFVRVTGLNSWEVPGLAWIKPYFQMTRPVIHVRAVLETWQFTEQRKAKRPAYSSAQKDGLVTQDLPLHLALFHPLLLRSDTEERKTRQCCHLYLGDLCCCFGQCQCSNEGIGWEFNQIQ